MKKIKKAYKKNLVKDTKIFLKKKRKKSSNLVVNVTKISQNSKNKSMLNIEKNTIEWEKYHIIIIRKYFSLGNFPSLEEKI